MIETTTADFAVPAEFLGKTVVIRLAIPIMQNGLSFPEIGATLTEDLKGALLLRSDNGETTLLPKSRVWSIGLASAISVPNKTLSLM